MGRAHRKLLLEALGLDPAADFTTFETLGNTGSVALPITAAMGIERGHVPPGRPRGDAGDRLRDQRRHAGHRLASRCSPSLNRFPDMEFRKCAAACGTTGGWRPAGAGRQFSLFSWKPSDRYTE